MSKAPQGFLFQFIGAKSVIQGMFNHAGKGASDKSSTNDKTETKELVSICVFEEKLKKGKDADYDFVESCLPNRLKKFFDEDYLTSAKKQLESIYVKRARSF